MWGQPTRFIKAALAAYCVVAANAGEWDTNPFGETVDRNSGPLERFGNSVAMSGSTLVVGAPRDEVASREASAFVYRMRSGEWRFEQELRNPVSNPYDGDYFGSAIAIDGDHIVTSGMGNSYRQRVFHFIRDEDGHWDDNDRLYPASQESGDFFGCSIAFQEQTMAVGASRAPTRDGSFGGKVHVFRPDGSNKWTREQVIKADDEGRLPQGAKFGRSVAVNDETLIIGAEDHEDGNARGAVYIYHWSDNNRFEFVRKLSGRRPGDLFGWSVALSGSTVAVGAIGTDGFEGEVRMYTRFGGSRGSLSAGESSNGQPARFGTSIDIEGNVMVVGALGGDGRQADSGKAFVFEYDERDESWSKEGTLEAFDGRRADRFGFSVAVSGQHVSVGAYADNDFAGSVYNFIGSENAQNPDPSPSPPTDPIPAPVPGPARAPAPGPAPSPTIPDNWVHVKSISCGAQERYIDTTGIMWEPDREYLKEGRRRAYSRDFLDTDDDQVYNTAVEQRSATDTIRFAIPLVDGDYFLRLHFAEGTLLDDTGVRQFFVRLEGDLASSTPYDTVKNDGTRFQPVIEDTIVSMSDGILNVILFEKNGATRLALINGIQIFRDGGGPTPTPPGPSPTPPAPSPTGDLFKAISCGAEVPFFDADRTEWEADTYGRGGSAESSLGSFRGAPAGLYRTYMLQGSSGQLRWIVPVPNGNYKVKLHFVETSETRLGRRVFDCRVEGRLCLNDYDILEETDGIRRQLEVEECDTTVSDRELSVMCDASTNRALVNAIEIYRS